MLRSLQALCLMSFFLADVRDGLGPFLGIFLTERHWRPDDIGFVMTAGGIAALLATVPAGIMIDATRKKRLLLLACCALVTLATLLLWYSTQYSVAVVSQIVSGLAAALIGPLVAGITLGLTGQHGFTRQMGRNEAFNPRRQYGGGGAGRRRDVAVGHRCRIYSDDRHGRFHRALRTGDP